MLNIQTDSIYLGLCRNGEIIKYQKRTSTTNDDLIFMERERPWREKPWRERPWRERPWNSVLYEKL